MTRTIFFTPLNTSSSSFCAVALSVDSTKSSRLTILSKCISPMVSRLWPALVSNFGLHGVQFQLKTCSSSMANVRITASSASRCELRGLGNRLHILRDQGSCNTQLQHHLPHSATCQCSSRSALRRSAPSCCAQLSRLGRSCLGR